MGPDERAKLNRTGAAIADRHAEPRVAAELRAQERRDFELAHSEGLHDGMPREGCPACPGRRGGRSR